MGTMYGKCNEVCFLHDADLISTERDCYFNVVHNSEQSASETTGRYREEQALHAGLVFGEKRMHSFQKGKKAEMIRHQHRANLLSAYCSNSIALTHHRTSLNGRNKHLETINEKMEGETFTEKNGSQLKASILQVRRVNRRNTTNLRKSIRLAKEYLSPIKRKRSNSVQIKSQSSQSSKMERDRTEKKSTKIGFDSIDLPISLKTTKISPALITRDHLSIHLSKEKLRESSLNDIIYDLEMSLIQQLGIQFHVSVANWQLNQRELKCSIETDKPIMVIPLENITKLVIGKNPVTVLQQKHGISHLIQVYIKLTRNLQLNKKEMQLKYSNKQAILEVGVTSEDIGIALIKAISFIKQLP